jgi:hypothetical protein
MSEYSKEDGEGTESHSPGKGVGNFLGVILELPSLLKAIVSQSPV